MQNNDSPRDVACRIRLRHATANRRSKHRFRPNKFAYRMRMCRVKTNRRCKTYVYTQIMQMRRVKTDRLCNARSSNHTPQNVHVCARARARAHGHCEYAFIFEIARAISNPIGHKQARHGPCHGQCKTVETKEKRTCRKRKHTIDALPNLTQFVQEQLWINHLPVTHLVLATFCELRIGPIQHFVRIGVC